MIIRYQRGQQTLTDMACDYCGQSLLKRPVAIRSGYSITRAARDAGWLRRSLRSLQGALADVCPACCDGGTGRVLSVDEVAELRRLHEGRAEEVEMAKEAP